jgi:hypothetical protein
MSNCSNSRSLPLLTAAVILVGLIAVGAAAFAAKLQNHNKELDKRLQAVESRLAETEGKRSRGAAAAATAPPTTAKANAPTTRRKPRPTTAPSTAQAK